MIRSLLVALAALAAATLALAYAGSANAGAVAPSAGCTTNVLPPNDDGSTDAVALPFTLNFFGNSYGSLYVNNNGNVTFNGRMSTYTPFPIVSTGTPLIAPYFGDVDTRGAGSGVVTYGATTFGGNDAFCVMWDGVGVGYYPAGTDKLNKFQLLLVNRPDRGAGDFDIVFNYDQIQWEAGSASGGSGGLGGSSARIGFSNGSTASFELPGSAVNGAFLDSNTVTGLIYNNVNAPTVPGRYVFRVENGVAPTGHAIRGHVWLNAVGTPAVGSFLQLCPAGGGICRTGSTGADGAYTFSGLADDSYGLVAFPPGGSGATSGGIPSIAVAGADVAGQDVLLHGPTPLPSGTSISTPSRGTATSGTPTVYWQDPITVRTVGCVGGTGTVTLAVAADGYTESAPLVEGPAGTYTGVLPAPYPHHGTATISIALSCGAPISFDIYIDPSGVVQDTHGNPVPGATVTLLTADSPSGTFTPVPDGSAIMSPGNRSNPSLTGATGTFGWDVLAGFYKVRAAKDGCNAPGNPSTLYVESAVLTIPPPVTGLVLTLDCPFVDTTPPAITADHLTAEATGPTTAVSYTFSATDPDDAVASSSCAPAPGSAFAVGSTPIHCTAADTHGNTANADFAVVVTDTTAPTVTVPGPITVNATSPSGAVVTYTASATDLVDGAVTPSCTPASGATFPAGDTAVGCTATDAHGNTSAVKTFTVHVKGAAEQLGDLRSWLISNHVGPGSSLPDKIQSVLSYLAGGDVGEACSTLRAFDNEVRAQTGKKVSAAQAAYARGETTRIETALGC